MSSIRRNHVTLTSAQDLIPSQQLELQCKWKFKEAIAFFPAVSSNGYLFPEYSGANFPPTLTWSIPLFYHGTLLDFVRFLIIFVHSVVFYRSHFIWSCSSKTGSSGNCLKIERRFSFLQNLRRTSGIILGHSCLILICSIQYNKPERMHIPGMNSSWNIYVFLQAIARTGSRIMRRGIVVALFPQYTLSSTFGEYLFDDVRDTNRFCGFMFFEILPLYVVKAVFMFLWSRLQSCRKSVGNAWNLYHAASDIPIFVAWKKCEMD